MWTFETIKGADLLTSSLVMKEEADGAWHLRWRLPWVRLLVEEGGQANDMSFYESFPTKGVKQAATYCFSNSST